MSRNSRTRGWRRPSRGRGWLAVGVLALLAAVALGAFACSSRGADTGAGTKPAESTATAAKPETATSGVKPKPPVTPPAPVEVSAPATDQAVPVLMYHHVVPNPSNFIAISPAEFDRQMKWLSDNGFHPVSMADFTAFVQTGKRLPDKPVLITFDDGRMNQIKYAVPILKRYHFTATFFVVKKWIVSPSKAFFHEADVAQLVKEGYDVESHTNSHTFIVRSKSEDYALMKKRLWGETNGMRVWLQGITREPVTALAYPGGGIDKLSAKLAEEASYSTAFTVDAGYVRYKGQSPWLLPRFNAGARGLSFGTFVSWMKGAAKAAKPKAAKTAKKK